MNVTDEMRETPVLPVDDGRYELPDGWWVSHASRADDGGWSALIKRLSGSVRIGYGPTRTAALNSVVRDVRALDGGPVAQVTS